MPRSDGRQYFIVKHDLESFLALPGFIWRTNILPPKKPRGFRLVKQGDIWIQFAYIREETRAERCSLINGFYRCTHEESFRHAPKGLSLSGISWAKRGYASMIEGEEYGRQPRYPVGVPPINELLGKTVVGRNTLIRISREEFEHIREETFRLELNPDKIPLLGREPLCEQEVLALVVAGCERLGINEILKVQTRFPDMLVNIDGREAYLELEVRSQDFQNHGHIKQLRYISEGKFRGRRAARLKDTADNRPVAVVCWLDNDRGCSLSQRVRGLHVFELQSLLRTGRKVQFA